MDYPSITFTMTTCKRLELFKQTMESFRATCLDMDLIKHWIISDDHSSEADIAEMKRMCPEFTILHSPERGQAANLNNLFDAVETTWFLHCEEDWLFLRSDNYIRKMFDVVFDDPWIKNVTLRNWNGGRVESTKTPGLVYNRHWFSQFDHNGLDIKLVEQLCDKTNCNWYGYTLNPGLQHMPTVRRLGKYVTWNGVPRGYGNVGKEDARCFDRPPAIKYLTMGYRSANIIGEYIRHIGDCNSAYSK